MRACRLKYLIQLPLMRQQLIDFTHPLRRQSREDILQIWTRIPSRLDIEAYAERLFSKHGLGERGKPLWLGSGR
ncbi:hypothetical protein SAMN05216604_1053 [Pseudomonas agarici]|nr:hypothetical protein SAMN05216604_1053 [Pseudomonas agarici]